MFLSVILSFAVFSGALASPISTADIEEDVRLPTLEELNDNRTASISSFYIPTAGIGAHKFHKVERKSWNDARNTCLNEGGHLVVINSAAEEAVIIKMLNENNINEEIWIGIHEQFKKDEWVSVKDQRLDAIGYIHWRQGEPNNIGGIEHCLVTNTLGVNDQECAKTHFFICEI